MDLDRTLIFPDTVFAQEIDGEMVLLDMASEHYFGLDGVATDIWKLLAEGKSLRQTVDALREVYDVDAATLEKDLEAFTAKLIDSKLAVLR